jgi:HD-GYP domain-containing protein (c-di-GMP phosphodiesterase class II)
MEQRITKKMENEFVYPDGSIGWFELSLQPVPEGVFILSIDMTERKRLEIRAQHQLDNLAALRTIDIAIASNFDLKITLAIALEQALNRLGVDASDVLLLDPQSTTLEYVAGRGFRTEGLTKTYLQLGMGHASQCVLERKIVSIPNLPRIADRFVRANLIAGEDFVAYFGAPLLAKGEVKGVLEVFRRSALRPDEEWLNFFETLAGQIAIAVDNARLFSDLQRSNFELTLAYDETIEGWSRALDLRDKETEGHTRRVAELTVMLARRAGMDATDIMHIRRGALLHDIGEMVVPDHILFKPGKLTDEEWDIVKMHPDLANEMLSPIEYLHSALEIPYCHHEKWDGSGYPRGLSGKEIPLAARLFAVVDVWDSLRSDRPYRDGWPENKARRYIRETAGTHFDPRAVEQFLELIKDGDAQYRS